MFDIGTTSAMLPEEKEGITWFIGFLIMILMIGFILFLGINGKKEIAQERKDLATLCVEQKSYPEWYCKKIENGEINLSDVKERILGRAGK